MQTSFQSEFAEAETAQPAGQIAAGHRRKIVAVDLDIERTQRTVGRERGAAAREERIAIAPEQRRHAPTAGSITIGIDAQRHWRRRQRDIGAAEQQLAAAQFAAHIDALFVCAAAVIQCEIRTETFCRDTAVRRFQRRTGQRQRPGHAQRLVGGCADHETGIELAGLPAAVGPSLAEQRLRPDQRHLHQIDAGVVGRCGLAMHFQPSVALAQYDIGERGRQVDAQTHRPRIAAAQFAVAAPASFAVALQRALPSQIAEGVAQARGIESADAQSQGAAVGGFRPVEAYIDLLQGRQTGADTRDIGGRSPRLGRLRPARRAEHEQQQNA